MMRIANLPGRPHLTYCTNIHAGETWDEIIASLDAFVPAIRQTVCPKAPFGIGLRLSGVAAAALREESVLAGFRDQLARLKGYVVTINAFPYGPFHGERVKEQVYEPDWRARERLSFTVACAEILAALLPEGETGSISTVPGAFRAARTKAGAEETIAEALLVAAAALHRIGCQSGREIALALEPEPACMLETTREAIDFLEERVFARLPLARFSALAAIAPQRAEEALRRHVGVCYDVCHAAVEFENPMDCLRAVKRAGVAIPKIQLSAALRIPEITPATAERLQMFDDGVYLHQVVVRRGGALRRFDDLPEALAAFRAGDAEGEWRVHCHVPVFLDRMGDLGSTQEDLLAVLDGLREEAFSPHLEVETYTWDVLPEDLRKGSKAADIAAEIAFVRARLSGAAEAARS